MSVKCATPATSSKSTFRTVFFVNHTRGITREYPPLPDALREIVEVGGNTGWLKRWWEHQSAQKGVP